MSIEAYYQPKSLNDAVNLLADHGQTVLVMAGGTIAMPLINEGITHPERVMGLRQAGLAYLKKTDEMVSIGPMTTITQIQAWKEIPLLQTAARHVGGWAVRNMGTVGGNLFAPPPAGDLAVALLVLDAHVILAKAGSERVIPLVDFYTGYMATALVPGELVTEIQVKYPAGETGYNKYGRKAANTPAVVTVAAHITREGELVREARLALNAVGPHPFRATQAETSLIGSKLDDQSIAQAALLAQEQAEPFTDAIASEWYRRKMTEVLVRRTLAEIVEQER